MLGDIMNIGKKRKLKNKTNLNIDDMVGRYSTKEPINSVILKHRLK